MLPAGQSVDTLVHWASFSSSIPEGDMATAKKDTTAKAGTSHGRGAGGAAPQERNQQPARTYRVVVIKDGVVLGGRQRRRRGLAS